jgi:hypothetical protein
MAFTSAPDFEAAADKGKNNVYDVVVQASDGLKSTNQEIAVTVAAYSHQSSHPFPY